MSRHTTRGRSGSDRTSRHDEFTGTMEAGYVPWL
jgi:hypothetical protein